MPNIWFFSSFSQTHDGPHAPVYLGHPNLLSSVSPSSPMLWGPHAMKGWSPTAPPPLCVIMVSSLHGSQFSPECWVPPPPLAVVGKLFLLHLGPSGREVELWGLLIPCFSFSISLSFFLQRSLLLWRSSRAAMPPPALLVVTVGFLVPASCFLLCTTWACNLSPTPAQAHSQGLQYPCRWLVRCLGYLSLTFHHGWPCFNQPLPRSRPGSCYLQKLFHPNLIINYPILWEALLIVLVFLMLKYLHLIETSNLQHLILSTYQ